MRSTIAFLALLVAACAAQPLTPAHVETDIRVGESLSVGRAAGAVELASFIRLLARPELFHGKQVQLVGFINLEFEGNALYFSKEQFEHGGSQDALWVDVSGLAGAPPAPRGWVLIEATFNAERRGHFGMFAGTLEGVTRLEPWRE